MNHLKRYKLFESTESPFSKEVLHDLNDMLFDIRDNGIVVDANFNVSDGVVSDNFHQDDITILITCENTNKPYLILDEFYDVVIRINNYLLDLEHEQCNLQYGINGEYFDGDFSDFLVKIKRISNRRTLYDIEIRYSSLD